MTGRILVGVDGSAGSRRALAWALKEAAAREWALEAMIVWEGPYDFPRDFYFPVDEDRMAKRASARLAEAIGETAAERAPVAVEPVVVEGDPAEILCQRAQKADLLVVGSRGHGTFSELLLGSVSSACAHHSPCPLVVVPARHRGSDGRLAAPSNRIVVGVDGSPGSRRALQWAADEAAARGATVQAVMVGRGADTDDGPSVPAAAPAKPPGDRAGSDTERAQGRLRRAIADTLGDPSIRLEPMVVDGDPARVLCQRAAAADLLVVGSHGAGSFAELSLGSVSAKCVRHSPCPVVIVPTARDRQGPTVPTPA